MSTIGRDIGMGCGRSVVIWVIAVAIGFPLGLCGVLSTVWLVTAFDGQPWTLCATAFLWLVPACVGAALFVGAIKRRARQFDELFVPLGLEGKAYMSWFRQYHGSVHGRQTDVYLWRGPVLQIEIGTPLSTRLGVSGYQADTSFFADLAGQTPLALADPELAALTVFALDETWARTLLADASATDALRRLTALGSSIFTRQNVLLRPGALVLMLSGNQRGLFGIDITAEQTKLWVDDLLRVLRVAETIPAPQMTSEPSSAEQFALRLRERNPYFEVWVGLVILGVFAVIAIIVFAAVFLLT